MAKIPDIKVDQTLLDIDKALEEKKKLDPPRHYLGMSQIGEPCWRKLFYSFRNTSIKSWEAQGIRNIEDGYIQEDLMAIRLQMLPYIELHTNTENLPITIIGKQITSTEENNNQIGFSLLLNHFKGHCDGMIKGIKEAPQTWHVWENKAVNESKFNKLEKLKIEVGEKNALQKWDEIYFAQGIIYMHCSETKRHYLTVQTPGGRQYTSCRTDYNKAIAESIITKAKVIIFDNWNIPEKLSNKREFYLCKWCEFSGICHDGDIPLVHCKTCRYSDPIKNGERHCHYKNTVIDNSKLNDDNCLFHIYNPALIPGVTLIEQQEDGCIYKVRNNGFNFANVFRSGMPEVKDDLDGIFTSQDFYNKIKNINNLKKEVIDVQQKFDGEINTKKAWD